MPSVSTLMVIGTITSENLREGMIVNKQPDRPPFGYEVVEKRNGFCDKGFHYGNGCFDRIATWWLYEKVPECGSKV